MGLLLELTVALGLGLVELLNFLVGNGGDALGGNLHRIVVLVGALEGNAHIAVRCLGGDHNGRLIGVLELEVRSAPVDRGVAALGYIAHQVHMGLPLHDLKVGQERAIIDGGSHLADTAADLGFAGAAVGVDDALLIALLRRALAHGLVEGEDLAGLEHRAVDLLTGQNQVGSAVGIGGVGAVVRGQRVGIVLLHVIRRRDLRLHDVQGDLDH